MTLNFVIPELQLNGAGTPPLQFYKQGFRFGKDASGGLPEGYTEIKGLTNAGNTYIDTDVVVDVDDVEFELRVKPTTGSWYIFQTRTSVIFGISGSANGNTILLGWGGNSMFLSSSISRDTTHIYYIKATAKNGNATLYVKDETANTENTKTGTYTFVEPTKNFYLWGNPNGDRVSSGNTIYYAKLKINGSTALNYIPCINSDNVAGFYDTASKTFKTPDSGSVTPVI